MVLHAPCDRCPRGMLPPGVRLNNGVRDCIRPSYNLGEGLPCRFTTGLVLSSGVRNEAGRIQRAFPSPCSTIPVGAVQGCVEADDESHHLIALYPRNRGWIRGAAKPYSRLGEIPADRSPKTNPRYPRHT